MHMCGMRRFSLAATKAKVLKAMEDRVPSQFKKFYSSQHYDKLVHVGVVCIADAACRCKEAGRCSDALCSISTCSSCLTETMIQSKVQQSLQDA